MNGKTKPYAILVFGAPMSGKTTFAEQFSRRFNVPFLNIKSLYDEYKISRKVALALITEIAKCKQTIVIEGGLNTEKQRNELRQTLIKSGYSPILIWIQTDLTAIHQRAKRKYKDLTLAKSSLAEQYKKIEAPAENERTIVISGKHTFQTQCRNVLTGISERKNHK